MRSFYESNSAILVVLCFLAARAVSAHAGGLSPCISATLSTHGKILVVNELSYKDPDDGHGRSPTTSTFRVHSQYLDDNIRSRMNGPDIYWTDPLWSVVLKGDDLIACPFTLVTDDGEYLILLDQVPNFREVLSIYRRRDDQGELVRRISLSELWAPEKIPDGVFGGTPSWFASGSFAFSPDNRTLIHKTRWGKTFQISLEKGEVRRM